MKRLVVAALMAVALLFSASPASAAPVYSGYGWKAMTAYGIYKIDKETAYVITFTTAANRTKFTPLLQQAVAQLQAQGVNITVSTTLETAPTACAYHPVGHIIFDSGYRPLGQAGMSRTIPCAQMDGSAKGGRVIVNTEYRQMGGNWYLSDVLWKNLFPHELGHTLGLDHPNVPANQAYACPSSGGARVTMCSPNGGYTTNPGRYTELDLNGVRQLLLNDE